VQAAAACDARLGVWPKFAATVFRLDQERELMPPCAVPSPQARAAFDGPPAVAPRPDACLG
jgi:hypothetical protein